MARHDFADLLRAVGAVRGDAAGAVHEPVPHRFHRSVIAAMAEMPAVCEHVHLPAQSGSNPVLKRMLRRYTREEYLAVVARLRQAIPAITFSTDIIVGFPGETEAQFQETLSLVEAAGFDDAYTFRYSVREGTPAVRLRDQVRTRSAVPRGWSGLSRRCGTRPAEEPRTGGEDRTRCWSSGRPNGGSDAGRGPGPT